MPVLHSIAICGCGPAGLAAALLLKRAGHHIALFERFAAPKPLGSGLILQPTGLAVMDHLGLGPEIRALGSPIRRLYGTAARTGRVALDVSYAPLGDANHALGVHRAALFEVLYRAATTAGLAPVTQTTLTTIAQPDRAPTLIDADGQRHGPFDLVIDASGSRSLVAKSVLGARHQPLAYGALWGNAPWPGAPFDPEALQQRYDRASVMIGVLPIGRRQRDGQAEAAFFWSLKPQHYDAWRSAGLDAWRRQVLALWPETEPVLDSITDPDQLVLASYGHHTLARPYAGHVAAIGDAAHSTSPQLGQGANMALLDALALAQALAVEPEPDRALALYARMRRRHVWFYQALSALFTPFYQSDSTALPLLRDRLFKPVLAMPGSRTALAGLVAGQWAQPHGTISRLAARAKPSEPAPSQAALARVHDNQK
jgi:salicylate hydroxylase